MKTAILCLAVFSIAFALPIAEPPSAHTMRKPGIEQKGSRSADVSQDAHAQERTVSVPVAAAPTAVDSPSSDKHNDEPQKKGSHSADVSHDGGAREGAAAAPAAVDSLSSDEHNDEPQKDAEIVHSHHSIDAQEVAPSKLNSHFSDATEDSYDQEAPVANDDSNREEIHFSDEDAVDSEPEDGVFFDAANDPEFKDVGFADDIPGNELASVDEDTDALTAQE